MIDELAGANYLFLIPAVAVYFVGVWFRALRWQFLLNPLRYFPVKRLYPVVVIGYAANNLLPMRLGELVRSYYLARQENFSASSALGSVAVERVFDGLTLIVLVAITVPWLLLMGEFDWTAGVSQDTATILAAAVLFGSAGSCCCSQCWRRGRDSQTSCKDSFHCYRAGWEALPCGSTLHLPRR